MIERINELADSWINGNRKWVAGEILETSDPSDADVLKMGILEIIGDEQMAILLRIIEAIKPEEDPEITAEAFSTCVLAIAESNGAAWILSLPGVYEIVAEELNNEVIDALS